MKKSMFAMVLAMVLAMGFSVVKAAEVTAVTVDHESGTISVQVGGKEYVTDMDFSKLVMLRVWRADDELLYDLDEKGVDTSRNYDAKKPSFTVTQAAKMWAKAIGEFEDLKQHFKVTVIRPLSELKVTHN